KNVADFYDHTKLKQWEGGSRYLKVLTDWLTHRVGKPSSAAGREWRLLEEGFSGEGTNAYRHAMRALWRITKPEVLERKVGDTFTFKTTSELSIVGIGIEAAENPDWMSQLNDKDAKNAFLHGAYAPFGYPQWMDELLSAKAELVISRLTTIIENE